MKEIFESTNTLIQSKCCHNNCYNSHAINVSDVCEAIRKLKSGKSDGVVSNFSNYIIHGTSMSEIYLSLIFNSLVSHGVVSNNMLIGTIIPLPKNKRESLNKSSNYRAITLSSIFGKILDNILLAQNIEIF